MTETLIVDKIVLSMVGVNFLEVCGGGFMIKNTKVDFDISVKVYLREKKGYFYAVLVYKNIEGKRREKWISTKLQVRGNKTRAKDIADQILADFEIPDEDLSFVKKKAIVKNAVSEKVKEKPQSIIEEVKLEDLTKEQVSNMLFSDYLNLYLPYTRKRNKKIEDVTYAGYACSIRAIEPYFSKKRIKLKDLTAKDINDFYKKRLEDVTANTVIHYHAIIRLSLYYAKKQGYISENIIEDIEKPEKNDFVGSFYTIDELNKVLEITKGTKLEVPVLMGGFYGLRRSECVGLRWNAFDFENNLFYINHTVVTPRLDGKQSIVAKDRGKSKSSLRALPLDENVKKRLIEIKKMQEMYQKKYKKSYNKKWLGYVMVDDMGNLIRPDYISAAFRKTLKKNKLRHIRFHDLRHTCASLPLNKGKTNGITLKDIQVWLGHKDFSTTANIYSHLDANSKISSLSTLSNALTI